MEQQMRKNEEGLAENKGDSENVKGLKLYWFFSFLGTLAACVYPIYMGCRVVHDMAAYGTVLEENFPKYIIPYTPIALAMIVAVLLLPVLIKAAKKWAVGVASGVSVAVFFAAEWLLESKVIVTATVQTTLESWQMYMCYILPTKVETRTWRAVDVLIGEYSPMFKLHFYLIAVVLLVAILNCLYGFGRMIYTGNRTRCKALAVQSVCTVLFLGLCILACFTAFFRDGEITVSALSAVLMSLFFIVLGVTAGSYTGSFLLGKKRSLSVWLPAAVGAVVTFVMYIGELFLLSGHLYRFGTGAFFDGIPGIVLAPADILIVVAAGGISGEICRLLNKK